MHLYLKTIKYVQTKIYGSFKNFTYNLLAYKIF